MYLLTTRLKTFKPKISLCTVYSPIVSSQLSVIPLVLKSGLFYMSMYPPSDKELEEFPHVTMTSADEWDPDHYDDDSPTQDIPLPPVFEEGKTVDHHEQYSYDDHVDACLHVCKGEILVYKPCGILPFKPDFTKLRPYFGWAPVS